MRLASLLITICLLMSIPLAAQDDEEAETQTPLVFGVAASGQITDAAPRAVYVFEGLRGEVVSVTLNVTSGDLDPVLAVLDSEGAVIASLDDADGSRSPRIESFRIERTDVYTVIVGRFGFGLGSTAGEFDLIADRVGVSSASGSTLRYGDSVINTISNMTPQVYYSFRAQRGDLVTITMERVSGNLDPYLQLVNSNAFVIADNDDVLGSPSLDAEINGHLIEEAGTYIIVASRFGQAAGTSTGAFVLRLNTAANSGLGNSPQAAVPVLVGDVIEGELTADQFARYYVFEASASDLITIRMSRTGGNVDAFLALANAGLQELVTDDDSGGGQNALIESYLIPADGRYYIIATRFEREEGNSAGGYRLELQSLGNAFDDVLPGVQRISYGTTLTGRIDDTTPELLFAFRGVTGDTITVSLNRGDGNLDPVVAILNSSQRELTRDDDSGGGQNARINRYVIPQTGLYYIRATRFSGEDGNADTQGSFILVLARRADS
jgi:hypothetical protein